jgi:hypothetical protein
MCYGPSSNHRKCRAGVYTCHESTMGKIRHLTRTYCIRKNSYLLNYSLNLTTWATIAFLSHCLTKIFLCPLQESLFLRFYLGRSSKTASSLIYSGAGEEHGIRYRERRRCCMRHTGGVVCRLNTPIARHAFRGGGMIGTVVAFSGQTGSGMILQ